jgi:hypothetical protein
MVHRFIACPRVKTDSSVARRRGPGAGGRVVDLKALGAATAAGVGIHGEDVTAGQRVRPDYVVLPADVTVITSGE